MMQDGRTGFSADEAPSERGVPEVDLASTLRAIMAGLRRRWKLIAATTGAMALLALVYILLATPQYTARAALVVDPRISNSLTGPEAPTLLLSDALVVDSEIKILSSREVTTQVARTLGLFDQPEEELPPSLPRRLISGLRELVGSRSGLPPVDPQDAQASRNEAIRREMMKGFEISRDGGTYAIDIAYTSPDPAFATRAVNTLVDEYFDAATNAAMSDTRRIHDWLEQRVQVLADEVKAADAAVAEYRQQNDLFTIRDDILPSQAELSNANDMLIRLRQDLIETQTRQDKIKAVVASGSVGALLDGTLGGDVASPALRDFQTRYAGLVSEERDLISRWGENSDVVTRNRQDQEKLREVMMQEASQIVDRLDVVLTTVHRQIAATEAQIEELRARTNADAQKSIQLHELERDADAKRGLYRSMLAELITSAQRETFQRSPARIIARAVLPDDKSSPRVVRTMFLAIFGGLVLGAGLAFLREIMDDRLRRVSQLTQALQLRYLGMLSGIRPSRALKPGELARPNHSPEVRRCLRNMAAELQQKLPGNSGMVTGITSGHSVQGRAQVASWLATELAGHASRVAVISLDPDHNHLFLNQPAHMRLPSLMKPLESTQIGGQIAAMAQPGQPVFIVLPETPPVDLLVPAQYRRLTDLMAILRGQVDHVILVLPPLSGLSETELAADLVDGVILTLRWGEERTSGIVGALASSRKMRPLLLGGIFTSGSARGFARYNR